MELLDDNVVAAADAMQSFLDGSAGDPTVSVGLRSILAAPHPSPVRRIVTAAEALYAEAPALPLAGVLLCAQLAHMAQAHGWHVLGQTGRAAGIIAACRRRLGELTEAEAPPEADPAPLADPANPD